MTLSDRKQALYALGKQLKCYLQSIYGDANNMLSASSITVLNEAIAQACLNNAWFTQPNVNMAINAISSNMLDEDALNSFLNKYPQIPYESNANAKIGIIMAGNIPLVGFHDLLCVILCGYGALIKMSSKDNILIPAIISILCDMEPRFENFINYTNEAPTDIKAVICTGSNNSARYFESRYANIPHIIRKNRCSLAILTGNESFDELKHLAADIFYYFGLGCRNVSALFVPNDYNFDNLLYALSEYHYLAQNNNYNDCYRYQKALINMDNIKHYDTGFLIIRNSIELTAPVALLNYNEYCNFDFVKEQLRSCRDTIQCIAYQYDGIDGAVKFGQTQFPQLSDYADGIDTINFLTTLV
jgi:hypothetical protein